MELINADPRFVTTSTCSGRISVFASSGGAGEIPSAVSSAATADAAAADAVDTLGATGLPRLPGPPGHGKGGGGRWVVTGYWKPLFPY